MTEQTYQKSQIATEQLKTAIFLFLNARDPSSVITLAGAASTILERLLRNQKTTTPFVDFACDVAAAGKYRTPGRSKYSRYINDRIGINDHKHMSSDSPDTLEIDLMQSAEDSITKAVADYVPLFGEGHDFIRAYLQWVWVNKNGQQIVEEYKKHVPPSMRRK